MELAIWLIFAGVVLIDAKLWKVVIESRRHNTAVEGLLREIKDRSK